MSEHDCACKRFTADLAARGLDPAAWRHAGKTEAEWAAAVTLAKVPVSPCRYHEVAR